MYRNLSAKEAVTIYVLVCSGEEAEKRATDAMSLIPGQNRKLIAMEFLVDRTVNWIAISSHDGLADFNAAPFFLVLCAQTPRAHQQPAFAHSPQHTPFPYPTPLQDALGPVSPWVVELP